MAGPIDLNEAMQKYAQNTPAAAQRWANRATARAQIWEANAKSQQAEANYATAMQYVIQNQLRLRGLQNVTAADYSQGVQNSIQVYQQKTSMAGMKWQQRFAPYANIINNLLPTLPPKVPGQPRQNWLNRGAPIAEALHQAKLAGVARVPVAPAAPAPAAPATPAPMPLPARFQLR